LRSISRFIWSFRVFSFDNLFLSHPLLVIQAAFVVLTEVLVVYRVSVVTDISSGEIEVVNIKKALLEDIGCWLLWVGQFISLTELNCVDLGNIIAGILLVKDIVSLCAEIRLRVRELAVNPAVKSVLVKVKSFRQRVAISLKFWVVLLEDLFVFVESPFLA